VERQKKKTISKHKNREKQAYNDDEAVGLLKVESRENTFYREKVERTQLTMTTKPWASSKSKVERTHSIEKK
jgi:hypothetical protein